MTWFHPWVHTDGAFGSGKKLRRLIGRQGVLGLKGYFACYFDAECLGPVSAGATETLWRLGDTHRQPPCQDPEAAYSSREGIGEAPTDQHALSVLVC